MATFPIQPVGTANAAVAPFAMVPGWTLPLTAVGTPEAWVCDVVMASPWELMTVIVRNSGGAAMSGIYFIFVIWFTDCIKLDGYVDHTNRK
jgi:hypothetical protein